jgi:general secretion pathway protein A
MFFEYYGVIEEPFGVTPDPRFLYLGSKHRQALAALDYGTETNRGFLTLIAKPGMGKTSLLYHYLESIRNKARTAFLFQTDGDSRDLMRYLLADLGLDGTGKDLPAMRSMLDQVLMEEMRAGRRLVLVIDEAQNLDEMALESIRLLSNFETPWAKLMHIVMAGQPQLAERLARPSMAQLRQRISFFIRIEPFTREEVDAYIDHRLRVAGYKGPPLFTADARELIAERSQGTPRVINNICFCALSLGWALKRATIDRDLIESVLADLDLGPQNGEAAVISKSLKEPIHNASQVLRPVEPVEKNSPGRGWLPRVLADGAVLIALGWSVVYHSTAKTRASTRSLNALMPAPVSADTLGPAVPDAPSERPTAAASANDTRSNISQPVETQSPTPSKGTGDADRWLVSRHGIGMAAEVRQLFQFLAPLIRNVARAVNRG